jgi:hypothetical protein
MFLLPQLVPFIREKSEPGKRIYTSVIVTFFPKKSLPGIRFGTLVAYIVLKFGYNMKNMLTLIEELKRNIFVHRNNSSILQNGGHMKKLLVIASLIALVFFGCNTDNSIVEPEMSISKAGKTEVNWIKLPAGFEESLKKDISTSRWVDGTQETLMEINTNYSGGVHGWVSVTANLRFQRNSFVGWKYISMSINDEFGTGTFSPAGAFLIPAIYNITIQGVDLSGVNPANVNFVYLAPDGTYQSVVHDGIFVDLSVGKLQISNARLPHFSRYGFTN